MHLKYVSAGVSATVRLQPAVNTSRELCRLHMNSGFNMTTECVLSL